MQKFIDMLSPNLEYISHEELENKIVFTVKSKDFEPICPFCGEKSSKKHNKYKKSFDDLPLNNKRVIIQLINQTYVCENDKCTHKSFAEKFDFIDAKSKKTKRLVQHILDVSVNMSSISCSKLLKTSGIKVSKSTICAFLKKR